MQEEAMKIDDQVARGYRKKAALELAKAFAVGLTSRIPAEQAIDVNALTDNVVALTKAQLGKLIAAKII
ncbi:MAG: hypothetical protein JWM78_1638 [Verrucomicrobiaceae bacterium]|nr:hypothetical protein [Verrucomicrobiaceae bacterium]